MGYNRSESACDSLRSIAGNAKYEEFRDVVGDRWQKDDVVDRPQGATTDRCQRDGVRSNRDVTNDTNDAAIRKAAGI